jgi:putative N6-adenine-specific DNA methylase
MYEYQRNKRFFAQIQNDMGELGVQELSGHGAEDISPAYGGIYFSSDQAVLYRINYTSRYITRILAPLISFKCHSTRYLYNKAKEINWTDIFEVNNTFAIFSTVSNSRIKHSHYATLQLKDAIVDWFKERFKKRPNIERVDPDVWINLHIENNRAVISLDTSLGSLHRRGYRARTVKAPMQETLAAAVIRLTAWDGSRPIYDPMCGSGTFLSEALMLYCRIPSGFLRQRFGFESLPDFDDELWKEIKKDTDKKIRGLPKGLISGSDISAEVVEAARTNINKLPDGDKVSLRVMDYRKIQRLKDTIIVCNPPSGIRLERDKDLSELYGELGDFLKQRCKDSTAYIYFGDRELIPKIGLKPSWKRPLKNGGLDGRLAKFEIY